MVACIFISSLEGLAVVNYFVTIMQLFLLVVDCKITLEYYNFRNKMENIFLENCAIIKSCIIRVKKIII